MLTHGKVYNFQIKYAIIHLLCKHFTFYTQCVYDNSWSVDIFHNGQDDIETVYNMVLDTEVSALPQNRQRIHYRSTLQTNRENNSEEY